MDDLIIMSAFMLTNRDLLVETNYGPLFLDEDDFNKYKFDPYYVVNNIEDESVVKLMAKIKMDYIVQTIKLINKGEISYEDIK